MSCPSPITATFHFWFAAIILADNEPLSGCCAACSFVARGSGGCLTGTKPWDGWEFGAETSGMSGFSFETLSKLWGLFLFSSLPFLVGVGLWCLLLISFPFLPTPLRSTYFVAEIKLLPVCRLMETIFMAHGSVVTVHRISQTVSELLALGKWKNPTH